MTTRELAKLIQANISDTELTEIEDAYILSEEGVIITLHNKGLITDSQYEEIVNNSELMLAAWSELCRPNKETGYLTVIEVTDREGWIIEYNPYETNVLDPNNEYHAEVCRLMQTALDEGNKVTISKDSLR